MTTVAILQPGYLPWCGYFEQFARADIFVHMDDVAFTRKDWRSRNRIKLDGKQHWLSAASLRRPLGTPIREIEMDYSRDWPRKHRLTIENAYRDAPHFDVVADAIFPILADPPRLLVDLNVALASSLGSVLNISTPCEFSSDYDLDFSDKSDRVLQICRHVGADLLYDGMAAKDFIDTAAFAAQGISVVFQDYQHPLYDQGDDEFLSHLSVIDLIAHTGPDAGRLVRAGGKRD